MVLLLQILIWSALLLNHIWEQIKLSDTAVFNLHILQKKNDNFTSTWKTVNLEKQCTYMFRCSIQAYIQNQATDEPTCFGLICVGLICKFTFSFFFDFLLPFHDIPFCHSKTNISVRPLTLRIEENTSHNIYFFPPCTHPVFFRTADTVCAHAYNYRIYMSCV